MLLDASRMLAIPARHPDRAIPSAARRRGAVNGSAGRLAIAWQAVVERPVGPPQRRRGGS